MLDRPVKPDDDSGEDVKQHSRGAICVRALHLVVPPGSGGRRECRALNRTRILVG
jgi:hypothetical protein